MIRKSVCFSLSFLTSFDLNSFPLNPLIIKVNPSVYRFFEVISKCYIHLRTGMGVNE